MAARSYFFIFLFLWRIGLGISQNTYCAYEDFNATPLNASRTDIYINEMGVVFKYNKTVMCPIGKNMCFTAWNSPLNNQSSVIIKQGCWINPADSSCLKDKCLSNGPPKGKFSSLFCCCQGSYCNRDFTQSIINETTSKASPILPNKMNDKNLKGRRDKRKYIIITLGIISIVIIFAIAMFGTLRCLYSKYRDEIKKDFYHYSPAPTKDENKFNIKNVNLLDIIDKGRYGTIWKAHYMKDEIVVKVFKHSYHSYYINERDIYCYPHMDHPNILKFIGYGDNLDNENHYEHWLALAYIPQGCLQNYLKQNTLEWSKFINIFSSIASGLSHLQKVLVMNGKVKPPIAHRDLNTRNVLIADDGNRCIIGDLGFAYPLITNQCKVTKEGHKVNGTTGEKTLVDVGTIRYMAPEVLEGSINLRDCEAALKQVDVYALALIMWEVGMRCTDFYKEGETVSEYQLPFQNEVGLHPTFEDMQILVARNKCRPSFPTTWKDVNEVNSFKETLEHCWDHDAEARLSAFCVEERVSELGLLWDKNNRVGSTIINSKPEAFDAIAIEESHDNDGLSITTRYNCRHAAPGDVMSVSNNKSEKGNSTMETYLLSSSTAPLTVAQRKNHEMGCYPENYNIPCSSYASTDVNDQSDKRLLPLPRPNVLPENGGGPVLDEKVTTENEVVYRNAVASLLMKPLKGLFLTKTTNPNNRTTGGSGHYINQHKGHHFL